MLGMTVRTKVHTGRHRNSAIVLIASAALAVAWPSVGSAVISNDYCSTATVVSSIPFTHTVAAVAGATGTDLANNAYGCLEPDGPHSVWYSYTPASPKRVYAFAPGTSQDHVIVSQYHWGCTADGTTATCDPLATSVWDYCYADECKVSSPYYWDCPAVVETLTEPGTIYLFRFAVTDPWMQNFNVKFLACGDGVIQPHTNKCNSLYAEACDDGNITNGDGCDGDCSVEQCWSCTGSPSVCTPLTGTTCGDDGNSCTADFCNAGTCTHPNLPDDTSCPTSNPCTTGATCKTGECTRLDEICVAELCGTTGPCVISDAKSLLNGSVVDLAERDLHVTDTGSVDGFGDAFSFVNVGAVTVDGNGALRTNVTAGGARSIEIDGSGPCVLNGAIQANGMRGKASVDDTESSSGSGGTIRINCSDISIGAAAVLEATGEGRSGAYGNDFGGAGRIYLNASSGGLITSEGSTLAATGEGTTGGTVEIAATGDCTMGGSVNAESKTMPFSGDPDLGNGGTIAVACANVALGPKAQMIACTEPEAVGGKLLIDAVGNVTAEKGAKLVNMGASWNSQSTRITAGDSCTLSNAITPAGGYSKTFLECGSLELTKDFKLRPKSTDSDEFHVSVAGACTVAGDVSLKGSGIDHWAGSFDITCGGALTQTKDSMFDTSCMGDCKAGGISLVSGGALSIGGKLRANHKYSWLANGTIGLRGNGVAILPGSQLQAKRNLNPVNIRSEDQLHAIAGDVSIDAKVDVAASDLTVEGCNVTVGEKAKISSNGDRAGDNVLIAHEALTVNGKMSALSKDPANAAGINILSYRTTASVGRPDWIAPATTPVPDGALSPCQ